VRVLVAILANKLSACAIVAGFFDAERKSQTLDFLTI